MSKHQKAPTAHHDKSTDTVYVYDKHEGRTYFPSRDVSRTEFHDACVVAGWDKKTIDLLLKHPPIATRVKVGGEGLKIIQQ